MPSLYLLVGVPGSGKSTWIKNQFDQGFFNKDTHVVISTDDYIERYARALGKTYNEVFEEAIDLATTEANRSLDNAVALDRHIIWDQTNTTVKARARKINRVPNSYTKLALVFKTPDDAELKRRLESRPGKVIPRRVMHQMKKGFEFPTVEEGFYEVLHVVPTGGRA